MIWISSLSYIVMIVINALSNILPIGGRTTGEISNALEVLFTPAGYVFSIWSVIYIGLGIWLVREWIRYYKERSLDRRLHTLFIFSSILNSSWILVWHNGLFLLSVAVMILLLITLIMIYKITTHHSSKITRFPFSLYLGWITVAFLANISYYAIFTDVGFIVETQMYWTIGLLLVTGLIPVYVRKTWNDWVYPLVFVWAFVGITVRNIEDAPYVGSVALGLAIAILASIFLVHSKYDTSSGYE
ncbi:tryptophan-rich sensory protein [Cytobacillus gottheilii]|uniref:tryptophan-rich sensory protein n=1 Tax=Cytobacillus gottheilii TaxID=859144 RepID=UPI0009BA89C7|nr:tryptophan-rich sensory protein [Cytobacillus gottheilii]